MVSALAALAMMAKPMMVVLPMVLLMIDYWPLRRMAGPRSLVRLLTEKLPLFAMSIGVSLLTFVVQQQVGAIRSAGVIGLPD